tara:strand:+ start:873 stop:974 length:102 start_codon:yes stop_codon:yes gene_type:complete
MKGKNKMPKLNSIVSEPVRAARVTRSKAAEEKA